MKKRIKQYVWGNDAETSGPRNYFRESLMISALEKYVRAGRILDAGCGTGSLSIRLAERGYFLTSIDTSSLSLHHLVEKAKACMLEGKIMTKPGSILALPFKDNRFNGIVCGEVLEHIAQDGKAIKELYRVLGKNGVCVVSVPAHPENWDLTDYISGHKRRYTKGELMKKFTNAGFSVVKSEYVGFPLNNLWHKYIFLPFLSSRVDDKKKRMTRVSFMEKAKNSKLLQILLSHIFYFDFLFQSTNKGNMLLLVAKKI